MRHNICNKEYGVRPLDFKHGYRCPYCSHGHTLKTQEEFENELDLLFNGIYTVKSKYKGTNEKIKILHNTCGKTFITTPNRLLQRNKKCPYCNDPIGEDVLANIFNMYHLKYESNIYNDDLFYKQRLFFDFYLYKLKLLIEYDGEYHFKHYFPESGKFNNFNYFMDNQLKDYRFRDALKNRYCIIKKLNLLRIPYIQFSNLREIISDINKNGIDKHSTTIEKYNLYCIKNGKVINDNNLYDVINYFE